MLSAVRRLGTVFPGTQVRLALTSPLHRPGTPRLHWVVTTCGLDGASVRPALTGVVDEALVYDSRGRLLASHRGGRALRPWRLSSARPLPSASRPTVRRARHLCGPWSQAYPDVKARATAAGYTDMQGCYRQADSTVVFLSSPTLGAAAAV